MTKTTLAALVLTAALANQAEAKTVPVQTMRQAGTLTCNVDPSVGLVFGSVRRVACEYSHYNRRGHLVRESYDGTMSRAGFDVGLTSGQTLVWQVSTLGGRNRHAMMSRAFSGNSADLTVVVGAGTNALFADQARIMLSPATGSGQVGVGMGFGVTGLDLQRTPYATYTSFVR